MDLVALTRQLVDIESITGNESAVANFLAHELSRLGLQVEKMEVPPVVGATVARTDAPGPERFNVYAYWPEAPAPAFVLSTHIDTVPPFIPSSEDADRIYGRGACDAKGIAAAQIAAALRLHERGIHVALLFLAGEERDSTGAIIANTQPRGSRFLINGEPTDNRLAIASKGSLRVELTAHGRMAHSAYPELGESAIDKLLEALGRLRAMELPRNPDVGPCTMNIGVVEGGRAPNVIPDLARALLLYRLVGPSYELKKRITEAVAGLAEVKFPLDIPFIKMQTVAGLPTMVAAFTTDIPALSNWGQPLLLGPGSIHVAHTDREFIEKQHLFDAVDLYTRIVTELHGN
jgi:acetylornithine deacetylase